MEVLALAIFLCFSVALFEFREWKHRQAATALTDELALERSEMKKKVSEIETSQALNEQSFLELKEYAYRMDEALKTLVKEKETKLSGQYDTPKGDYFEEI